MAVINVFADVLQRLYAARQKVVTIDNAAAKLHYRFTFWLLLACTTLVCHRQYFGRHIKCMTDKGLPDHVVETYCYFTSTYTLQTEQNSSYFAHPGVGPHGNNEKRIYHAYYQWVPFILFGQALLFYLPHLIWKTYEGGKVLLMAEGLKRMYLRNPNDNNLEIGHLRIWSDKVLSGALGKMSKLFHTTCQSRLNRGWASTLVFSEFLYLVNVVVQLYVLQWFLGGNFWNLGIRIIYANAHDNPFDAVFPKVTKCDFHKYGPTGTIQVHDAMCVMALNIINEKIYTILWFWLAILVPVTILALVWRLVTFVLHSRCPWFNNYLLREVMGTKMNSMDVAIVTQKLCYSDWLLLYYVGSSMNGTIFAEFLHHLAAHIERSQASDSAVKS